MRSHLMQTALLELAGAFARRVRAGALSAWRAFEHRRAVKTLTDLDARMLKDIGLTYDDVQAALDVPLGEDPSRRLAALNHNRLSRHRHGGLDARPAGVPAQRPTGPLVRAQAC